jgi:hypothetical protein
MLLVRVPSSSAPPYFSSQTSCVDIALAMMNEAPRLPPTTADQQASLAAAGGSAKPNRKGAAAAAAAAAAVAAAAADAMKVDSPQLCAGVDADNDGGGDSVGNNDNVNDGSGGPKGDAVGVGRASGGDDDEDAANAERGEKRKRGDDVYTLCKYGEDKKFAVAIKCKKRQVLQLQLCGETARNQMAIEPILSFLNNGGSEASGT